MPSKPPFYPPSRTKKMYNYGYLCPCGYYSDVLKPCTCAHSMVTKPSRRFRVIYQKCISGPLLDRIDIRIEVPRVDYEKPSSERLGESSAAIREQVEAARRFQRERFEGTALVCPVLEPELSQCRYARGGDPQVLQAG